MLTRLAVAAACTLACSLAQAQPVVRVELFRGSPTVVKDGKTLPASPGLELARNDQIAVPTSGWLVLQILKNGFAVKIDEDLVLPVSDIALLDAPRQAKSFDEQLAALAKAKEIELNDRVTGYQNRKTAGTGGGGSKAASRAAPPPPAVESAPKADADAPKALQPAPPPPAPAPAPAAAPVVVQKPMPKPSRRDAAPGGAALEEAPRQKSEKKSASAPPAFRWAKMLGGTLTPQDEPLDEAIVDAIRKAKIEQCIRDAFRAAQVELPQVDHLLLRKVDGKVQVKLGSQLSLAASCVQAFDGVAAALPEKGWVHIEIRLSK